jgi:hypothetical protein
MALELKELVVKRGGMKIQAYPAAKVVAPRLHDYFARQIAEAVARGEITASVPDVESIEQVINAAFWGSLLREEGYVPRVSLALLPPDETEHPLLFERPLSLSSAVLTRIAPAVERPGIHLGIWRHNSSDLCLWGTTRSIRSWCIVLEVVAPGLLVVKHHRGDESGKFTNVAVLEGDQIKLVDERASSLPDCPPLLQSLLGFDSPVAWVDSVNVLVQLAVSMRAHGHGGSLLVVPAGAESWRESIVRPIPYAISPPFAQLKLLGREVPDDERKIRWEENLRRTVDAVAGLTAVDGATVISTDYEVLGFGAKIARRKGAPQIEQVMVTEPIVGGVPALVHPEELGGTRHLTAAQFVQDQRDAVALVASQDGRFTIFAWSPCEEMVHAHRVEALLL